MALWAGSPMQRRFAEFHLTSLDIGSCFCPFLSGKRVRGGERRVFVDRFFGNAFNHSLLGAETS